MHQSAELYGSDRLLGQLAIGLDRSRYYPIVILPESGPLETLLRDAGVDVRIVPLSRLTRATLRPGGLARLPFNAMKSVSALRKALSDVRIDLVYSNTLAVLTSALYAKRYRLPHVWHVHEIILRPAFVRWSYSQMLNRMSDEIIYDSGATAKVYLDTCSRLKNRCTIVWNGHDRPRPANLEASKNVREKLGLAPTDVLAILVGRINRWKGQLVLVEAMSELWQRGVRNLHVLFLGNTPKGQDQFLSQLMERIENSPARTHLHREEFCIDPWPYWDACDIGVVPSTEPEPFGQVALEAMSAEKPVIAAAHGGLCEVVVDQETGLLVRPGDAHALADALEQLITSPEKRTSMGQAGRLRGEASFSKASYVKNIEAVFSRLLPK